MLNNVKKCKTMLNNVKQSKIKLNKAKQFNIAQKKYGLYQAGLQNIVIISQANKKT